MGSNKQEDSLQRRSEKDTGFMGKEPHEVPEAVTGRSESGPEQRAVLRVEVGQRR